MNDYDQYELFTRSGDFRAVGVVHEVPGCGWHRSTHQEYPSVSLIMEIITEHDKECDA